MNYSTAEERAWDRYMAAGLQALVHIAEQPDADPHLSRHVALSAGVYADRAMDERRKRFPPTEARNELEAMVLEQAEDGAQ